MKYLSILFFVITVTTFSLSSNEDDFRNSYTYRSCDLESKTYSSDGFSSSNPYQSSSIYLASADESQDSVRMHHQWERQCELVSSAQRWSCRTYTQQQLGALLCSSWGVDDFARATEYAVYQAMQHGGSRADVERELLSLYEYYYIPAFRDYLKTFSGYRPHIKKMRDRLVGQKVKWYRVLRALGFLDQTYVYKLDLAEKLYAEILEEEKEEQRVAQHKQRQQELQAQQVLQNTKEATQATFDKQREALQQLSDEWTQVKNLYQEYDLCDDGRYEQRRQALDSIANDGCSYETKSYTIAPATAQFIHAMGGEGAHYQTCYGNQLQHVIHQECIDGINYVASLPETSVVYPYKEAVAHCFDAACGYNQAGEVDKATTVADLCWSLLDYGKALAEGAVAGVFGAIEDMLEHPGQTLLCAVAGEYVLAYHLSKVLFNVADIGITYAFNPEHGKQKWDECVAPVTHLIDAINKKELSLRDGLKGGMQFAVQWKAQGKLLKGMNKFCKTAKAKALEFAKNHPSALPEQYMTTPEGMLLQGTQNLQPPASGPRLKYRSRSKFFAAHEQEIVELTSKNHNAIQPTQKTLQAIGTGPLNAPEKFFKHVFTAELIEKTFLTGKVKRNLAGFHHHVTEHLNEMGIKLLNSRTCNKTGLIISDVLCDGHVEPRKTFFPSSWSREKVILKIGESLQNLIKPPMVEGTKGVLFGQTSEGIVIRTVVDIATGEYITAYPDALANNLK